MDRTLPSLAMLVAALLVAACAPATRYQGVSLAAGGAEPEIQSLASRAATGDKWAQLELGIRYEDGRGVPMDWRRAERLYRAASRTTGGTIMVYMPPVRRGGTGSVMPVSTGPRIPGLPEARARLEALRKRRQAEGSPRRI